MDEQDEKFLKKWVNRSLNAGFVAGFLAAVLCGGIFYFVTFRQFVEITWKGMP